MNKIAIQGHSIRGLDVIKILESLGGINSWCLEGSNLDTFYWINAYNYIRGTPHYKLPEKYLCYTLEEYEQQILNNMENKRTISIDLATAREWYNQGGNLKEIALQAFSENELQSLPKSWEEYCKINPYLEANKEFFLAPDGTVTDVPQKFYRRVDFTLSMSSKKKAKQFVILNKLLQIRDYYNQGWVPNWTKDTEEKYCIINNRNTLTITVAWVANYLFVFKTKELRDEFLTNFKEDLEFIKEFL